MSVVVRTLTAADAEVMARTVEFRTSVKGRVECHGLIWKSDALLDWEIRQRELGAEPKVEVRVDELDLQVVYVSPADGSAGPYKAISTQPEFTERLSLFELRRLKKAIKDQELGERLHRLSDQQATKLRIEFYALLGHGKDPAAQKRLTELQDLLARERLKKAGVDPEPAREPGAAEEEQPAPKKKQPKPRKSASRSDPAGHSPPANQTPSSSPDAPSGAPPETPASTTPMRKPGELPQRKFTHFNLDRRDQ